MRRAFYSCVVGCAYSCPYVIYGKCGCLCVGSKAVFSRPCLIVGGEVLCGVFYLASGSLKTGCGASLLCEVSLFAAFVWSRCPRGACLVLVVVRWTLASFSCLLRRQHVRGHHHRHRRPLSIRRRPPVVTRARGRPFRSFRSTTNSTCPNSLKRIRLNKFGVRRDLIMNTERNSRTTRL